MPDTAPVAPVAPVTPVVVAPAHVVPTLDGKNVSCAFESNGCTNLARHHGGFDKHHRQPKSMGGREHPDDLLTLCPTHHSRQHSLIRYLVESDKPVSSVTAYFTAPEVAMANYAVDQWTVAGKPPIEQWSRPAAT